MLKEETWKAVVGFEGLYEVSSLGRIKSLDRTVSMRHSRPELKKLVKGAEKKTKRNKRGYVCVSLHKDGREVTRLLSRLVCEAFNGPCPEGMECCHGDGDKENNSSDNLRWDTHANNIIDRTSHDKGRKGESHHMTKITEDDVRNIRDAVLAGERRRTMAEKYKISISTVDNIVNGTTWGYVK